MTISAQNPRKPFPAWLLPNGVAEAPDTQLENSIESCERWEWFGGGLVFFGVFVAVAIAAFHPPYDSFLEQWGSAFADGLVAIGVAIEIKFGQMAGVRQGELRRRSNDRLAGAETRAAEAQEELRRFRAPRALASEQASRVTVEVAKFSNVRFCVACSEFGREIALIAASIVECLLNAKWKPESYPFPIEGASVEKTIFPLLSVPIHFGGIAVTDVLISYSSENEGTKAASKVLVDALQAEGIRATLAGTQPGCPLVLVLIGPKT
jgi:hypothetical protein